jgi:hypothetical protein
MKKSNDTIGNRTCNLLACSAVPQLTAPPRAPVDNLAERNCSNNIGFYILLYRVCINYRSILQPHIFTNIEQKFIMLLTFEREMFTVS